VLCVYIRYGLFCAATRLEITRDCWKLLEITRDYWRLLEITRDYWRLLESKLLTFIDV